MLLAPPLPAVSSARRCSARHGVRVRCSALPRPRTNRSAQTPATAAAAAAAGAYTAANRYRVVQPDVVPVFQSEIAARAAEASKQPGFVSQVVTEEAGPGGASEFLVAQTWVDKAAYEAWMNTPFRRRSHLNPAVWQARAPRLAEPPSRPSVPPGQQVLGAGRVQPVRHGADGRLRHASALMVLLQLLS